MYQRIIKNIISDKIGKKKAIIDFDSFTSQENRSKLKEKDIELITWNDIKKQKTVHNTPMYKT